jgi:multidrug efflux pump subunit AcrA (membrane-fusion protein)
MTRKLKLMLITAIAVVVMGGGIFLVIRQVYGAADADKKPDDCGLYKVDGETISASRAAATTAGIDDDFVVKTENIPSTLTLSGRTDLDQNRVTHVHAQFPGRVVRVGTPDKPLQLGDKVRGPDSKGGPDTLCTIESTDLANAKAAYLQADVQLKLDRENLVRTQTLLNKQVLAEKYLLDAQAAVTKDAAIQDAARQQLLVFGLTDADIKNISSQQGKARMTYNLTSPSSGMIVEKGVVGGELADPTLNLFTVADTSRLWVWGDVYERDRPRVKEGQKMTVILTSDPDHPRVYVKEGVKPPEFITVRWISPVIDVNTRAIKIRGELDNSDGRLLAQMYATLIVTVNDGSGSIVVPADAVVRKGPQAYVFVRVNPEKSGKAEAEKDVVTWRRTRVKVEPISAGPGLESIPVVSRNALTHIAGGPVEKAQLRVIEGLAPGQHIVQSGALGLFNEMEQQQSQLSGK